MNLQENQQELDEVLTTLPQNLKLKLELQFLKNDKEKTLGPLIYNVSIDKDGKEAKLGSYIVNDHSFSASKVTKDLVSAIRSQYEGSSQAFDLGTIVRLKQQREERRRQYLERFKSTMIKKPNSVETSSQK